MGKKKDKSGQYYEAGRRELQKSVEDFQGVQLPTAEQLTVRLQAAVYAGDLSPIEAQVMLQKMSEMYNIEVDPELEDQQFRTLATLRQQAEVGGLDDIDKAHLFNIFNEQDRELRGRRQRILQEYAERGLAGSGLEMAERLQAGQEGSNRAAQQALEVAALAQQRRREANLQAGEMAGDIRTQQFGEQAQAATAQDAIEKFNTQNRQNVELSNVGNQREVARRNIDVKQDIEFRKADTANKEKLYNAAVQQQMFENQLAKEGAKAGVRGDIATMYAGQGKAAQEAAKKSGGLFSGILGAAAGIATTAFTGGMAAPAAAALISASTAGGSALGGAIDER